MDADERPVSAGSPAEWSGGGHDDVVATALGGLDPAGPATQAGGAPAVRVVHGRPDEVELAALVAGIVAARTRSDELGGIPDEYAPSVMSRWTDHGRRLGLAPQPGTGSWRWSAHP
ncbi:acyl-CoA carboxylase subunit epsilon [Georgenia deserti]|uniref:Acyl-CoA carboxylase subunit epsilon n=1 Tax=Georgenia deserti TaxID=2093781 RepID=A0ABW4L2L3_9MICO